MSTQQSDFTGLTINTYLSDMIALERHISAPLEHQRTDDSVAKFPEAKRLIDALATTATQHVTSLEARLQTLGGHGSSTIKNTVAGALGSVAAAVGDLRKTEVTKYLRDDYSALALVSASYTLLHTTALAMGDRETATLAETNLRETAQGLMRVSATLPTVVLQELALEGVTIDPTVRSQAESDVERAWKPGTTNAN